MNAVCAIGHRGSLRKAACSAMVGMPRLTFALGMAGVGRIVLAGPTPVLSAACCWQASGHQCAALIICDGILCVRCFKGPATASLCGQRDAALSQAGAGHLRSPECIESQATRVGAAGRPCNGGYKRRRSQEDCPCGRRRASGGAVAQSTVSSGAHRCKPTSIGSHATSGNKQRPCVLGASERSVRVEGRRRVFAYSRSVARSRVSHAIKRGQSRKRTPARSILEASRGAGSCSSHFSEIAHRSERDCAVPDSLSKFHLLCKGVLHEASAPALVKTERTRGVTFE